MVNINRIFVEKKSEFSDFAQNLLKDIKENLRIFNLENIRILNRYDIEFISNEIYQKAKNTIFSEPPVDLIFEEEILIDENEVMFAVEYLPGQYDQRADSAMQCIELISEGRRPLISSAKVFILKGNLSDSEIKKIKQYCINPVDSREANLKKPETLNIKFDSPNDVEILDFINKTEEEVKNFRQELGLVMNDEDFIFCQDYFKNIEKRNPSITEIKMIDTYWSDHCRHTTFATNLNNIEFEDGFYKRKIEEAYNLYLQERQELYKDKQKNICLMDIATIGMKALRAKGVLQNLDVSEEINACSIIVNVDVDGKDEEWLVMFKNETHNHPTEVEPFGGAATCLGGAIRDPLSGRSYVYQAMRVTGSGDPRVEIKDTLAGKLPQRKITKTAAAGYSSYGNQIGLATGQVVEIYDEGYVAKRMEIGAVIGANKKENVVRNVPKKDDVIILTGGRTGRDGCGGATGSSKEHTESSLDTCSVEVQKGNAPTERKLQRLFRNPEVSKLIKRCNDFGAGGISVAIGELADGLNINLDLVPKKYEGLDGTEIAISESQERMAVVVSPHDAEKFIQFANDENLEATVVAKVTDDRRLKMFWRGKEIVNLSRDFLDTNGVTQNVDVFVKMPKKTKTISNKISTDLKQSWLNNLKDLNVCSQKGLSENFDSTIGAGTILMPFGGKNQLTPAEAMVAKIPVLQGETNTVSIMSYGYNPIVAKWSSFHSAIYAVVDSISKVVATGGYYKDVKLTFQEYFEKLGNDKEKWGKPFSALIGALYAQLKLKIAAIGGKDSMSGSFKDMNVPPTLVSFAIGISKCQNIISPEFKEIDNHIIVLNTDYDEYELPIFENLIKNFEKINSLIKEKKVKAISTIGIGGIGAVISKMCLGNYIGACINISENLFNYNYGSFILEIDKNVNIEQEFKGYNIKLLGNTINEEIIYVNNEKIYIDEIQQAWLKPLEEIFPTKFYDNFKDIEQNIKEFKISNKKTSNLFIAKPRVFIPVFPGTNCEYDTQKAFEKAGAITETLVIKNFSQSYIKKSMEQMVKLIKNSQIVMIPGGFSAGDEPDGSGKFIAAIFRNSQVSEAIMDMLKNRDGLMLGICNGFQALIKLGLVPYGEIKDMDENSPTLTYNTIGRHISCFANTKVISDKSPWLWKSNVGDVHKIAFSHGEGRFIANQDILNNLIENGQIATQYVDDNKKPTYDIRFNPNNSYLAIEGITSPDGRVLGKMGHSERIGNGLYQNIPGNKNQKLFEAGVNYFK